MFTGTETTIWDYEKRFTLGFIFPRSPRKVAEHESNTVTPLFTKKKERKEVDEITAIQVDDTFGHQNNEFFDMEDTRISEKIKTKSRKNIGPGGSVTFNVKVITFEKDQTYTISQTERLEELQSVRTNEDFKMVRAKIQYIGVISGPDLSSAAQL